MGSPEEWYQLTLDEFGHRVRAVRPDQWGRPTPCADWDVRALVNHVTSEQLWAVPLLAGATIDEVGDQFDGDVLGADPVAAWTRAAESAGRAFAEPDAWERTVELSFGPTIGAEYGFQMTLDLLVHGWDLAVALGVAPGGAPGPARDFGLVHELYVGLTPQAGGWRSVGVFGEPVELASVDGGDEWFRLLALTGRDPHWRSPAGG